MWDIKGKALNVPIYELLGGAARDRIKVYSWIGGDRPDDVAEQAQDRVDRGFTAVKMNATEELHYIDSYVKIEEVVERVIRNALVINWILELIFMESPQADGKSFSEGIRTLSSNVFRRSCSS